MSEYHTGQIDQYCYTQNRELSWLHFNQRVLEEAADRGNPPLERLKFISIFSGNLDEFFMVRVGSLFDLMSVCPEEIDSRSGMTPAQQLQKIYDAVPELILQKKEIYSDVLRALEQDHVMDLTYEALTDAERSYVKRYFKRNIFPIISPIIIGSHNPVPHLENKGLYLVALLQNKQKKSCIGLIQLPNTLPAYVRLPGEGDIRYIRIENILLKWAPSLFGAYQMAEAGIASVTRNADIRFDDDPFDDPDDNFRSHVATRLKSRGRLSIVRLELSCPVSDLFLQKLMRVTKVSRRQVMIDSCPLNMKYVFKLADEPMDGGKSALLYPPYHARWPEDIAVDHSIMDQVRQRDKLLFFPFDSTEPFLKLLAEAAERPDVVSVKITIYRLASSSQIARLLCRAAENGKQVIVIMELRARFDEANNIEWSKLLENSGCQVFYGLEGFKCHSKICLITMRNKGRLSYLTQIGTGNYNEKTSTMYTDLSLLTASREIGEDATEFFHNMLINNLEGDYEHLLVSPSGIETAVCRLIGEQIQKKADGYICIKINSLTEREIMEKLVEASQAGVTVDLIVRGICCILPGIAGYTDNIHVSSIVGRFLEHARVYCFGRGDDCKLYLSSADFMSRNLRHRVEVACPIYDREVREQVQWILDCQLKDSAKASSVTQNGTYRRKLGEGTESFDSQQQFMDGTIHKLTEYTPVEQSPWERLRYLWYCLGEKIKKRA